MPENIPPRENIRDNLSLNESNNYNRPEIIRDNKKTYKIRS
jgi:hypothetical protein